MNQKVPPSVLIVQRRLTHYRMPFFEGVRARLAGHGVLLNLVVGTPTEKEREKKDEGQLDWAIHVPCTYAIQGRICWQNFSHLLKDHENIVVTQENKLVNNIPLLLGPQRCRVGLWGHGRNFQATQQNTTAGFAQRIKVALSRRADWWFAYTEMSADIVKGFGYPSDRITVLNNSIDTAELGSAVKAAAAKGKSTLRATFGLPTDGTLGLFLGSLYAEKRLDLLVDGAILVREKRPDFHLAVVGSGPQADWLRERTVDLPWIHILGARRGQEKADLLAASDLVLNPGLVGLGILDAFVAGLPMVTTDCRVHSPEISYLKHGENGLMTPPDPKNFSQALLHILQDGSLATHLQHGALQSAEAYSVDAMVRRFSEGILTWRQTDRLSMVRR